jgi:hypothetical protein
VTFDYRHWGDSDGHPRGWFSLGRQQSDWRAAVAFARQLDGIDPDRVALWGFSMGGALPGRAEGCCCACWQSEGISMRSSHGLRGNSTCLALTAVTRCLRIRTPVPEMAGRSPRKRPGVIRPQESRTRVPGDPGQAVRLISRIPGAVWLWSEWARASRDTLLGLHDTGGTNEQPSQLRSRPGRTRCGPAR